MLKREMLKKEEGLLALKDFSLFARVRARTFPFQSLSNLLEDISAESSSRFKRTIPPASEKAVIEARFCFRK
jgi:hypothetical protein